MQKHTSYSAVILLVLALIGPMLVSACGGKAISNTTDDATITARVKTVLVNDPDVAGRTIDVSTAQGVVTLSGTVKTPEERDKAVGIARKVGGVKDVKSTLQIQQ